MKPALIIHGGAGSALKSADRLDPIRTSLHGVLSAVFAELSNGANAENAAVQAVRLLEDDPLFNAGTGGCLQVDGRIRLSAALMHGGRQSFSGIINGERIRHPIELAAYLQDHDDRVLAADGVAELCRELGIEIWDNVTKRRLDEWLRERSEGFSAEMASVASEDVRSGTVGAVAVDRHGVVVAATSTGGRGFERIGRVSDTATPSGNYANEHAGVSATGVGEHILDEALASTIVVRRTDGLSLQDAMLRTMESANDRARNLGAIAADREGRVAFGKTSAILLAAFATGEELGDTLDLPAGLVVGGA